MKGTAMKQDQFEEQTSKVWRVADRIIDLLAAEKVDILTAKQVLESVKARFEAMPVVAANSREKKCDRTDVPRYTIEEYREAEEIAKSFIDPAVTIEEVFAQREAKLPRPS